MQHQSKTVDKTRTKLKIPETPLIITTHYVQHRTQCNRHVMVPKTGTCSKDFLSAPIFLRIWERFNKVSVKWLMEYYLQDLDSFKHWQATGYVQKVIFYDIVQANQNILFDVLHPSQ